MSGVKTEISFGRSGVPNRFFKCARKSFLGETLTLSMHAQQGLLKLGQSLRVLVPKLASHMFIHAKINTPYLTGDADQMISGNFAMNASFNHWHYLLTYSIAAVVFCTSFRQQCRLKLLKRLTVV